MLPLASSGSVCPKYNAADCMCQDAPKVDCCHHVCCYEVLLLKRCHRCCVIDGMCQSLVTLNEENSSMGFIFSVLSMFP